MKKLLLMATKELCDVFAHHKPIPQLVDLFTEHEAVAISHGHPCLAPWLGVEYIGRTEIAGYFGQLFDALSLELMIFADPFIDEDNLAVTVMGTAKWTYKKTGKSWMAAFTWVLEFAEGETEGDSAEREVKIRKYSVWADSGAVSCTTCLLFTTCDTSTIT